LSGALVFRLFGLSPKGVRYDRGRAGTGIAAWACSAVAVVALVTWQLWSSPDLQRSTQAQHAASEVKKIINGSGLAKPVDIGVRFTRADIAGQNTLLVVAYVQANGDEPQDAIKRSVTDAIRARLLQRFNAQPLIDLTVLER